MEGIFMKKFMRWGLAALATFALMLGAIGNVSAIELGCYDEGVLVPRATHNGSNIDTVVGLTANAPGIVYWTYFSKNSDHLYDANFKVTKNDLYSFSLATELGCNLLDEEGYIVFSFDRACDKDKPQFDGVCGNAIMNEGLDGTPTNNLAANAFLVDTATDDAIFIPVLPLDRWDYEVDTELIAMDDESIWNASNGIEWNSIVDIRYWIDPAYCATTQMVVWTIGNRRGIDTVVVFNDVEKPVSLTMCWRYKELNLFDPTDTGSSANDKCHWNTWGEAAAFTAWPTGYIDGFMRIEMPAPGIAYSYITSTYFGAAQTLLAAENCGDASPDGVGICP
jgi:hypothetical protein